MSIGPTRPPQGPFYASTPSTKKSSRRANLSGDDGATAKNAELQREAAQRTAQLQDQVQTAEQDGQTELDHLKDQYDNAYEAETERGNQEVQSAKEKGYERLRETQRAQDAEIARVRRDGEAQLAKAKNYYLNATYGAEIKGKRDLQDLESKQAALSEYERRTSEQTIDASRREHAQELRNLNDEHNERYSKMQERVRTDYEKQNAAANESIERARSEIKGRYQNVLKQYDDAVGRTRHDAGQKLDSLRRGYTEKLSAYETLKSDPFYRMYDLGAKFTEHEDHYELTADIPENERKNVSVSLKGNQLVLSGYRRSEETEKLEPGHTQSTNAYQTFSESFACLYPVDGRRMSTQFEGGRLTVILPKKSLSSEYSPYHAKSAPKPVAATQPQFPDYLPAPSTEPKKDPTLG